MGSIRKGVSGDHGDVPIELELAVEDVTLGILVAQISKSNVLRVIFVFESSFTPIVEASDDVVEVVYVFRIFQMF
jgi:hypothetical protein